MPSLPLPGKEKNEPANAIKQVTTINRPVVPVEKWRLKPTQLAMTCAATPGGFKSEVQHLQPCKVRRCKAPRDTTSNFSLKTA